MLKQMPLFVLVSVCMPVIAGVEISDRIYINIGMNGGHLENAYVGVQTGAHAFGYSDGIWPEDDPPSPPGGAIALGLIMPFQRFDGVVESSADAEYQGSMIGGPGGVAGRAFCTISTPYLSIDISGSAGVLIANNDRQAMMMSGYQNASRVRGDVVADGNYNVQLYYSVRAYHRAWYKWFDAPGHPEGTASGGGSIAPANGSVVSTVYPPVYAYLPCVTSNSLVVYYLNYPSLAGIMITRDGVAVKKLGVFEQASTAVTEDPESGYYDYAEAMSGWFNLQNGQVFDGGYQSFVGFGDLCGSTGDDGSPQLPPDGIADRRDRWAMAKLLTWNGALHKWVGPKYGDSNYTPRADFDIASASSMSDLEITIDDWIALNKIECIRSCPADLNGDNNLSAQDIVDFFGAIFSSDHTLVADITDVSGYGTSDGKVGASDVVAFFQQFFDSCP